MYVRLRSAYWTTAEGRKYCLDNFFNASLKLKYSKLNFRIIGAKLRSLKMISAGGSLEISLKNPIVESILCIISRLVLLSQINLDDTTSRTFILNLTFVHIESLMLKTSFFVKCFLELPYLILKK